MKGLIELLEGHANNETMIDRKEFVDTLEEAMTYSRGKSDGMTYLARIILKRLSKLKGE